MASHIWYYADGGTQKGPCSLEELIEALSKTSDPVNVLVWRNGFDEWRAVDQVREVATKLFRPPPLPRAPARPEPTAREPSVSEVEAAQFKGVEPQLAGIGGWLVLVAIGQVLGPLRTLASFAKSLEELDKKVFEAFPITAWGEIALNIGLLLFGICVAVLFFRHSRRFPAVFIWEWLAIIALPFVDATWIALSIAYYTGRSPAEFFTLNPKDIGQSIGATIVGTIWITYILRSRRVANTFVK